MRASGNGSVVVLILRSLSNDGEIFRSPIRARRVRNESAVVVYQGIVSL